MADALMTLTGYGVSFGKKPILQGIDLTIPDRGMTVLLGPSGTGKSTLLRTLAGINDANPSLQVEGQALFQGALLGVLGSPAIVIQKTRLMMATLRENLVNEMPERNSLQLYQQREVSARLLKQAGLEHLAEDLEKSVIDLLLGEQRLVALIRTIASNPKMIFVDEPTAGIDEANTRKIIHFLRQEAEKRAVVTITHNLRQARELGGQTALLAGGTIVEAAPTDRFFDAPATELAKVFIRTGSCCAPSPGAHPDELDQPIAPSNPSADEEALPPSRKASHPRRQVKNHAFGPRNFLWLKKGHLAGTPRPGLTLDLDLDLVALRRVGVSVLVSLESEVEPIAQVDLDRHFIQGISFPIRDMGSPDLEAARQLCIRMHRLIQQGEAIALHCKAGIGRTGTMLVAYLIWEGMTALDALERARKIEPRWVQSQEQVDFLERFEGYVLTHSGVPADPDVACHATP